MEAPLVLDNRPHTTLAALGLRESVLRQALLAGASRAAECTVNHPASAAGFYSWADTFAALAEMLILEGWTKTEVRNLPVLLSPDNSVGLIVSTGDDHTGKATWEPAKKTTGPQTVEFVKNNRIRQLQIPGLAHNAMYGTSPEYDWDTWVLLFYRDVGRQELRAELSRPVGFNGDLKAGHWAERLMLEPISLDPEVAITTEVSEQSGPDIEVEVTRKQ
jgi:hypothetical protein